MVEDSFASVDDAELHDQLAKSLRHDGLNIVVIGGGIMGLALANALKMGFGDRMSILVIENRIQGPHIKEPFNRHWLTHISNALIEGVYDPLVSQLLVEFGNGTHVGATLAVIETLLLVSNKKLGVRFLFKDDYDSKTIMTCHLSTIQIRVLSSMPVGGVFALIPLPIAKGFVRLQRTSFWSLCQR